ncbi:MAG: PIN domain-containing protein [Thermomicrobiales bacterium]
MIVYVETNFVLELALLQTEHQDCSTLLEMATAGEIALAIPAFSLSEPYGTLIARGKRRKDIRDSLHNVLEELSRSEPYGERPRTAQPVRDTLNNSAAEERQRLDAAVGRIAAVATILPLDGDTFQAALALLTIRDIPPQDALVYSAISQHMQANQHESKCFITTNIKDFANPDTLAELAANNCRLLPRFNHGVGYIRSRANRTES